MAQTPTALEFAILGLVRGGAPTGYAISQVFADTPLATYSPSPGSIYPAVKRLLRTGLLEEAPHPGKPETSRRALRVTASGDEAFLAWLTGPVTRDDVERDTEGLFLRLAFMSDAVRSSEIGRFLRAFEAELNAQASRLMAYVEAAAHPMSPSATLAFSAGLARVQAYADWARAAAAQFPAQAGE